MGEVSCTRNVGMLFFLQPPPPFYLKDEKVRDIHGLYSGIEWTGRKKVGEK